LRAAGIIRQDLPSAAADGIGEANPALASFWDAMPAKAGAKAPLSTPANAESILPAKRDYYRFSGSLTTPPCSEGVLWLVMKEPVSVSEEQVAAFTRSVGFANNRPLQPLNARVVLQ
jgi:carbonic anhydrase